MKLSIFNFLLFILGTCVILMLFVPFISLNSGMPLWANMILIIGLMYGWLCAFEYFLKKLRRSDVIDK